MSFTRFFVIYGCLFREVVALNRLVEEAKQGSCCHCRPDDSCHVRSHGVHEEEVVAVVFQT